MGRPIRTFTVLPHLPERLQSLQKLAYNMWWCWNHEATALFRRIDLRRLRGARPQPRQIARRRQPNAARRTARGRRLPRPHGPRRRSLRPVHERRRRGIRKRTPAAAARPTVRPPRRNCRPTSPSPISAPNSACMKAYRFIPAASAFSAATISRAPATSACRWSASA